MRVSARQLDELIGRFRRVRVLVVGDLMLDQFVWGRVQRISPEAPVPVVSVTAEDRRPGGAGNVVSNIAALGGKAAACGIVGHDAAGEPRFIAGAHQCVTRRADGPWRGGLPLDQAALRVPDLQRRQVVAVAAG